MGRPGAGGLRYVRADACMRHQPGRILDGGTGQSHLAAGPSAREESVLCRPRSDAADGGKFEDGPLMPCSGAQRIVFEEMDIVQMEGVFGEFEEMIGPARG